MNDKTLVLLRKTNGLRIYNEDDNLRGITYTAIYDVSGLKTNGEGWYDIYNKENSPRVRIECERSEGKVVK